MWTYKELTREEFEKTKDKVEQFIKEFGGKVVDIQLPYEQKNTSYSGKFTVEHTSLRPIYELNKEYFRVDEICFRNKPFIVIEFGSYEELMSNTMEDAGAFPYDLSERDMRNEVFEILWN